MIKPSTFSIVGCDVGKQEWGVAVASKFLAVGAVVPWAQAGVGAVATQAMANTSFGPNGLTMLAGGKSAEETLQYLLSTDPEREHRQVGMVDSVGGSATFTGMNCYNWAGGVNGPGYAIQGNILVGDQVVPDMEKAFLETKGDLTGKLYAALSAGDKAGGDRRGRQSAAIYVVKPHGGYGGYIDRWLDLRVDDHKNPVAQLGSLLELHQLYFEKSAQTERLPLSGDVLHQLQEMLSKENYLQSPFSDNLDAQTCSALDAFIGNENFEERFDSKQGWIDKPVFDYLMKTRLNINAQAPIIED
jgi:uncharacterized Ntn-hydrolase superfamily protein